MEQLDYFLKPELDESSLDCDAPLPRSRGHTGRNSNPYHPKIKTYYLVMVQ